MDHDSTDRGLPPRRSLATQSAEQIPWEDYLPLIAFIGKTRWPEGLMVEEKAETYEAYAQALASRYSNRPDALEALRSLTPGKLGPTGWKKFPTLPELTEAIESWLTTKATPADLTAAQARRASLERQRRELGEVWTRKVEAAKAAGNWPPPGWKLDEKGRPTRITGQRETPTQFGARTWKHLA